jgi:tRNA G26 N,N-dimethylase Trm1
MSLLVALYERLTFMGLKFKLNMLIQGFNVTVTYINKKCIKINLRTVNVWKALRILTEKKMEYFINIYI